MLITVSDRAHCTFCPECGAKVMVECYTPEGQMLHRPHAARFDQARANGWILPTHELEKNRSK